MTGENWTVSDAMQRQTLTSFFKLQDILYDAMESQAYATVVFAGLFMLLLYFAIHCK